jgi:hypothetical protein
MRNRLGIDRRQETIGLVEQSATLDARQSLSSVAGGCFQQMTGIQKLTTTALAVLLAWQTATAQVRSSPREVPKPWSHHPGNVFIAGEEVRVPLPNPEGHWNLVDYDGRALAEPVQRAGEAVLSIENLRVMTDFTREHGVYSSRTAPLTATPPAEMPDSRAARPLLHGMSGQPTPRVRPGVCFPWEEKMTQLPEITGDKDLVRKIWEDIDALGNVYIWQLLLSF